ncbi:MAG: hypothetical protein DWG82_02565 [Chloroflexi bacterium]|nr:hypothetical protein [Chloroflexota bacterium]
MTIEAKAAVHLSGLPASGGDYRGPALVATDASGLSPVEPGYVLVAREGSADHLRALCQAGALVTVGGVLSNLATVARELRIPTVLLEEADIATIHTGHSVRVRGSVGAVEVERPF